MPRQPLTPARRWGRYLQATYRAACAVKIKPLAKRWSPEHRAANAAELRRIVGILDEYVAELER